MIDYQNTARKLANAIFVEPNKIATVDHDALVELARTLDAGMITPQSCLVLSANQLDTAASIISLIKNPPAPEPVVEELSKIDLLTNALIKKGILTNADLIASGISSTSEKVDS